MAVSKGRAKGKAKVAAKRQAAQRGKDLEGVQYVRTTLPLDVLGVGNLKVNEKDPGLADVIPWRDLVLHTIDESMATLEAEGADLLGLTVVTFGTKNPHEPGELVVEVKSRPRA